MKYSSAVLFLSGLMWLGACGNGGMNLYPYKDPSFSRGNFAVCHGFNCYYRTQGWITDRQWRELEKLFTPPAKTAEAERKRIARAIGRMEYFAGLSSGLNADRAEAETFEENRLTQMDCIDETVNTDMYLHFLQDEGWLTFHKVTRPVHRGYFVDGAWPHNAAAVRDSESGAVYVVDSYFGAHARDAHIVPLKDWADFWRPVGAKRGPKAEEQAKPKS